MPYLPLISKNLTNRSTDSKLEQMSLYITIILWHDGHVIGITSDLTTPYQVIMDDFRLFGSWSEWLHLWSFISKYHVQTMYQVSVWFIMYRLEVTTRINQPGTYRSGWNFEKFLGYPIFLPLPNGQDDRRDIPSLR